MNRCRVKSRHLLGVERLESRHLLSAEGFDFSLQLEFRFDPHGFSVEVSRQPSQLRGHSFRSGSSQPPLTSSRPAEGEWIDDLASEIRSQGNGQALDSSPRIVVILELPVLSVRPQPPSRVPSAPLVNSVGDPPVVNVPDRSSAAVLATPGLPGDADPARDRVERPVQASDVLQLVSVTPPETPIAAAASRPVIDIASPRTIGAMPEVEDSDVMTFDQSELDSWIQRGHSIEHELAELEILLEDLAQNRATASRPAAVREGHRNAGQSNQDTAMAAPANEMILLLPGAPMASHWPEIVTQIFGELDDAMLSQWTTDIGCFRALDFADGSGFAAAAMEATGDHGLNLAENDVASVSQSTPPWWQRVFGVLVCCAGLCYLRNRRQP